MNVDRAMCNPYVAPFSVNPEAIFSIIAALATVVAAIAAWYSATQSSRSLKIGSNPILYAGVDSKDISPEVFDVYIKNIGSGLARDIRLDIPALNIKEGFSNIEKEKQSDTWKVKVVCGARQNGDKDLLKNPKYTITYRNIFGDSITTVGHFNLSQDNGRPGNYRVSSKTEWDIRF